MRRRKTIDIKADYRDGKTRLKVIAFQKKLQQALRPIIFDIKSIQELHFEALKHILPINKSVRNTSISIENGIKKVLDEFNLINRKYTAKIINLGTGKELSSSKDREEDPLRLFQMWILGYEKVPALELLDIKKRVKRHLSEVNELRKYYEELPLIKNYNTGKESHRNHKNRTIIDFYKRCVHEQNVILDYYLNGMYKRALSKSQARLNSFSSHFFTSVLDDFPYEYAKNGWGECIDYREIDCFSHRVPNMGFDEISLYRNLYSNDKKRFYKKILKNRSKEDIFGKISFNLEQVSLENDRAKIFANLKELFKSKNWLAFYSLALPQVEGLFAEMVNTYNPKSPILSKSLPDKVNSVRPYYSMSTDYFDYYQYKLPNQRNTFSHTGIIDDVELRCYDLLTDLEHLSSTILELDNPYVKLNRILKSKNRDSFCDHNAFNEFYDLIENLPTEHANDQSIKLQLEGFKAFLREECELEYFLAEADVYMMENLDKFKGTIINSFKEFPEISDWTKCNKHKLVQLCLNDTFVEAGNSFTFYVGNREKILSIHHFLEGTKKHIYLDKIPKELEHYFEVWKKEQKYFKWIITLQNMIVEAEERNN